MYVADGEESGFSDTLAVPDWDNSGLRGCQVWCGNMPPTFGDPRLGDEAQHSVVPILLKNCSPRQLFFFWKLLLPPDYCSGHQLGFAAF